MKKKLLESALNSTDVNFYLLFNSDESLYFSKSEAAMKNEKQKRNISETLTDAKSIYYTNLTSKEKFKQSKSFDKLLITQKPVVWELTQETKIIGKYNCYKATTSIIKEGRNGIMNKPIVAWYTPQIPVSFGVQSFSGLPGLTLQLTIDEKIVYRAVKIELNSKEKIIIKKPKGKIISSEKFYTMLKNARR